MSFTPKQGQKFYYIIEAIIDDLPCLDITSDDFDYKNNNHTQLLSFGNCFKTEKQAEKSLKYGKG